MDIRLFSIAAGMLCFLAAATPNVPLTNTFTVTNVNDSGAGSLRQAILDVNANPAPDPTNPDRIVFAIPGGGVKTIAPSTSFDTIIKPVVIDGFTQTGAMPNTNAAGLGLDAVLTIELDGENVYSRVNLPGCGTACENCSSGSIGLGFHTSAATVKGLVINRFGVQISFDGGTNNAVKGNYIGTDPTGTFSPGGPNNGDGGLLIGVALGSSSSIIGGTLPADRNLISGQSYSRYPYSNRGKGILVGGFLNVVAGNLIGTNAAGNGPLIVGSQTIGIWFGGTQNTIGGTSAGARNVISANTDFGIYSFATQSAIKGNVVGRSVSGGALGNGIGIYVPPLGFVGPASQLSIGDVLPSAGNVIAFNHGAGVRISDTDQCGAPQLPGYGISIRGNSIFNNDDLGISLGNGANNSQSYPVLTSAAHSGGRLTANGSLNSTPNSTFAVDFYSNAVADPSNFGEGETYVGSATVITDGSGNAQFNVSFADVPGNFLSATATAADGSTSGFSADVTISGSPHPPFFNGEIALSNGVYYLAFPNGTPFGYYSYLSDQHFIYHIDMGFEYLFDANDGQSGIFFYDFASSTFFYTSPSFPFPYLYDFSLNALLYYYPDPNNPGRYSSNPRYFYDFATGQIITK